MDLMFGIETEYAFTPLGSSGRVLDRDKYLTRLIEVAKQKMAYLTGNSELDIYLANGSRLYLDCGGHPELSTPECTTPIEAVKYIRAGERILTDIAETMRGGDAALGEIVLAKCNVDYVNLESTWGCHESYLYRRKRSELADQLIPHLVSRIVFTGAGGLNTRSPGIEFSLSPRVDHIEHDVSDDSMRRRGIFHTKDEPLCGGGYHRLHIICGESLCSQVADFLRVGTTALVVALIDAGHHPAGSFHLRSPVGALHRFAADAGCTASVDTVSGAKVTAIGIQRRYLEAVESNLDADFMPPWAAEVCRLWRDTLDRLELRPDFLETVLDWPIKLSLFKERARRRGFAWESLPVWAEVLAVYFDRWKDWDLRPERLDGHLLRFLLDHAKSFSKEKDRLARALETHDLSLDDLDAYFALRAELTEIDIRFGMLGPTGIFAALDRQGVLNHRLLDPDDIESAVEVPPDRSRARLRGKYIRQFTGKNTKYRCSWNCIMGARGARKFDLSDPFRWDEERH